MNETDRKLAERKLVEEGDHALTEELFSSSLKKEEVVEDKLANGIGLIALDSAYDYERLVRLNLTFCVSLLFRHYFSALYFVLAALIWV